MVSGTDWYPAKGDGAGSRESLPSPSALVCPGINEPIQAAAARGAESTASGLNCGAAALMLGYSALRQVAVQWALDPYAEVRILDPQPCVRAHAPNGACACVSSPERPTGSATLPTRLFPSPRGPSLPDSPPCPRPLTQNGLLLCGEDRPTCVTTGSIMTQHHRLKTDPPPGV